MFFVTAKGQKLQYEEKPNRMGARAAANVIALRDDYFYLRDWAVSAFEKWGLNGNNDGFLDSELRKAYLTFQHQDEDPSWVCINHKADCVEDSIGENMAPVYTPELYVEVIMGIDRERAEKKRPGLELDIKGGVVTDTSMGCFADYSVCTACGNIAHDASDYCDHLRRDRMGNSMKGTTANVMGTDGKLMRVKVGELYFGVNFVENSIIESGEGADLNAKIFEIAAARQGNGMKNHDNLYYAVREMERRYGASEFTRRFIHNIESKA